MLDRLAAGEEIAPPSDPDSVTTLGYTPEISYLALIADRLLAVRTAVQAGYAQDGKEPSFKPLPRPTTALDRIGDQRVRAELLDIERQIFGGGLPADLDDD